MNKPKIIARIEQLIRTADITGIDTIACGNQECLGELFRFKIVDGDGLLLCSYCGRESVRLHLKDAQDSARN